jgi:biotin---protein ligase
MQSIFIYRDEGVCPSSLSATIHSLKEATSCPIKLVKRETFLENGWEDKAAMVVFPGGRDVPYFEALKGAANLRIRNYVMNGGRYLGICAGAYYGSASICFEPGNALEVIASRELAFFPGCANGPALGLGQFVYDSPAGARIVSLSLMDKYFSKPDAKAYYNGGCTFAQAQTFPNVTVLAHYDELKESPAIILCQVGKGKALLSGVHPEYRARDLKDQNLRDQITLAEPQRKELFSRLIALVDK